MKINSLHIAAFGGIKNLGLDFKGSFNIVYGDNENGKTTVMSFIKMMFYGTERSGTQLNKNLRKKYTPWDGSPMAGSIDFESHGRNYRIERIFGNSNSTDKVTLIDLSLGEREVVAADIGVKLFGLSAAAFERSIFIGQFGFPESNNLAEGELNSKLSNIALTGDEAISFDEVNKRLESARYELISKSGRSGIYDKNAKAVLELEKELEKSQISQEAIEKAKQTALTLSKEIEALNQKADILKAKIESENDFRNAEKLKELLNLKSQLDSLNQSLTLNDGSLADEMFVRKVEFCLSKIDNIKAKIDAKKSEIAIIDNNLKLALNPVKDATPQKAEELTQKIKALEGEHLSLTDKITELTKTPKKKSSNTLFILGGVLGVLGGISFLLHTIAALSVLATGVILIFIGIINTNKIKSNAAKAQAEILDLKLKQNSLISVIASEKANLTSITAALNSNTAIIESQKELLKSSKDELADFESRLSAENETLYELFSAFKTTNSLEEISTLLTEIKLKAANQKEIKQNINYILKDVGNISYDEIRAKLSAIKTDTQIDFEATKTEYENVLSVITERKTQLASILTEMKALSGNAKNPESIKKELEALKQKATAQKEYCDSLDIALHVLLDSYAEVRKSYGSVLEKKAGEIFAGLTGGRYENMSISKSFDITVQQANVFGIKELDYLSSGTQDQAYLSLRLALSYLISDGNEGLPIILDDTLSQYDDKRVENALEFLKEYSKGGQIIMFTCHKAITNAANNFGANQINLS